jgi:hypothetical protein
VQVVHLLGEQDEELEAEHSALQERLQELHGRKQVMDRLVRDLQAFGDSPTTTANQNDSPSMQNGVFSIFSALGLLAKHSQYYLQLNLV